MRYAGLIACLFGVIASANIGCGPAEEGSGDFATQIRDLTGFVALDVSDSLHAYVHVDDSAPEARTLITVSGDDNLLERVSLDVSSLGALVASTGDERIDLRLELRIEMTIHDLTALRVADDAYVAANNVSASHFNLEETDNAAIFISGKVDALDAALSDQALLDGRELVAEIAFVQLLDDSHANICATKRLMSDAEDTAKLDIYCEPEIVTPMATP